MHDASMSMTNLQVSPLYFADGPIATCADYGREASKLQSFSRIINWHLVAQGASPSSKFFHEFLVLNNALNMAPPLNLLIRALVAFEDVIIRQVCDLHIISAIHSKLTSNSQTTDP